MGILTFPIPLLGFTAYSGTGKTTLLTQVIPLLKQRGIRLAVIKHAHHHFDIDHPGKDSHRIRESGADLVLVSSRYRLAYVEELTHKQKEPVLEDALQRINSEQFDLVLVEGFKHAAISKIILYRAAHGGDISALLQDPGAVAVACQGEAPQIPDRLPTLDINNIESIADFVASWLNKQNTTK